MLGLRRACRRQRDFVRRLLEENSIYRAAFLCVLRRSFRYSGGGGDVVRPVPNPIPAFSVGASRDAV